FDAVRRAILADPYGQAHTTDKTTNLYQEYFGRDPTASELGVWNGLLNAGANFDTMTAELMRQSAAGFVQHLTAIADPQAFTYGTGSAGQYMTISGFDAAMDTLEVSQAAYGGMNLLDPAHARQLTALDGSVDTLITLDSTHAILFEHTPLAALHASSFLFG
ncbi:MAG: hypothetical protein JOZ27_00390, partial [Caulobacteraceae bacterium]|nr:hypothetical protein [Caulobacteraceae bacterium]